MLLSSPRASHRSTDRDRRSPPGWDVDRQCPHDRVLGQVRVLIFIDQDVAIALVEPRRTSGFSCSSVATCSSRSSKSTALACKQPPLIRRIDPLHDAAHRMSLPRHIFVRPHQVVLGPRNRMRRSPPASCATDRLLRPESPRPSSAGCRPCRRSNSSRSGRPAAMNPQQPRTKAVKRPHPHRRQRYQPRQPGPHLVGRLVGERQRQDLLAAMP